MKRNKYWFKSKRFGWGFVPISWEGWLSVALLLGLIYLVAYLNGIFEEPVTTKQILSYLFDVFLIILISLPYHQKRSRDKIRWRWGK
ncbi:MAG: hypothetical protein OEX81_02235 [Candidatus Pacebacteria bacterium]|nr:hypothetical protein [Candidatus Paceibacterota bacterium]